MLQANAKPAHSRCEQNGVVALRFARYAAALLVGFAAVSGAGMVKANATDRDPGVRMAEKQKDSSNDVSPAAAPKSAGDTATTSAMVLTPTTFAALPGWAADDQLAAWKAFIASCPPVLKSARVGGGSGVTKASRGLLDMCELALLTAKAKPRMTRVDARAFFESHFVPHEVSAPGGPANGLLTGYYEPLIEGSLKQSGPYQAPIYKRPADLVNVVAESERGAKSSGFTHMRKTTDGLKPFLTRAEIDKGGLKGLKLELLYLRDPIDVFFTQIQGSARVRLPGGKTIRITYDGKNGYPYTSIGRVLIDAGHIDAGRMSLKSLAQWLKADRARAQPIMWKNESYVFFRELEGEQSEAAMGVLGIPLQTGRSLAVDTAFHAIGMPIYVSAPEITHARPAGGFARLMVAHDVGSAIKGAERGDIFFGSGTAAGRIAGVTKHPGQFFVLLPRAQASALHTGGE